jgi:Holliday junction resolvase
MKQTQTRAPKQLGDFGEGLVTYAFIRKGYEIAFVDHVGADLIAEKNGNKLAMSVKTRMFKTGSKESQVFVVEKDHLAKLEHFATQFGMLLVFALLISLIDECMMHLLIMPVADLKKSLPEVKHGYSIRFTPAKRSELMARSFVDYSCWKEEKIGDKDFF